MKRPLLVAPVSGITAWLLHQVAARELESWLASLARANAPPDLLDEVRVTVAALRAAANEWTTWRVASVDGRAEVVDAETEAGSRHGLSTDDAAAALGVSARRVRQLCARGDLDAWRVGRAWLVEPAAVDLYLAARRSA